MDPKNWEWRIENSIMMPVKTDRAVAPDNLLKIIKCTLTSKNFGPKKFGQSIFGQINFGRFVTLISDKLLKISDPIVGT